MPSPPAIVPPSHSGTTQRKDRAAGAAAQHQNHQSDAQGLCSCRRYMLAWKAANSRETPMSYTGLSSGPHRLLFAKKNLFRSEPIRFPSFHVHIHHRRMPGRLLQRDSLTKQSWFVGARERPARTVQEGETPSILQVATFQPKLAARSPFLFPPSSSPPPFDDLPSALPPPPCPVIFRTDSPLRPRPAPARLLIDGPQARGGSRADSTTTIARAKPQHPGLGDS